MAAPTLLVRGNDFARRVRESYAWTVDGQPVHAEVWTPAPVGASHHRQGRMDLFIVADDNYVVVIEIKATDWARIKYPRKVVGAHRRQVWRYIDAEFDLERVVPTGGADQVEVTAGIIYPRAPEDPALRELVEAHMDEWGIQVVWFDEGP